ncbi:MAG: hypothetical protein [Bacteriophage sp.]|nr:MAG: hypothetical protein [Bacteriophage sp.]
MKKLKITAPQWANYTGSLGVVHFTNGVSDEFVPDHIRRRLSIGMEMIEIDVDGNESRNSAAYKLLSTNTIHAPVNAPLSRQTETEKAREDLSIAMESGKQPTFYTRENLEAIADKEGIKGLREAAEIWDVKHRSIPALIDMILAAQEKFLEKRKKRIDSAIEKEVAENNALKQAAISGDLSKAINAVNNGVSNSEIADASDVKASNNTPESE